RSTTRTVFLHVVLLVIGVRPERTSDGRFWIVSLRHVGKDCLSDRKANCQPEFSEELHGIVVLLYIIDHVRHLILVPQLHKVLLWRGEENGRTIHRRQWHQHIIGVVDLVGTKLRITSIISTP